MACMRSYQLHALISAGDLPNPWDWPAGTFRLHLQLHPQSFGVCVLLLQMSCTVLITNLPGFVAQLACCADALSCCPHTLAAIMIDPVQSVGVVFLQCVCTQLQHDAYRQPANESPDVMVYLTSAIAHRDQSYSCW